MNFGLNFFLTNSLLGVGLAMDAFSVSLANGLNEPCMKRRKVVAIAGTFSFFQALMPMLGWICVHTIVQYFKAFEMLIPWAALILLSYIGGKMLLEGLQNNGDTSCSCEKGIGFSTLIAQGIATSIDALSVGFAIAEYNFLSALIASLLIALVTFMICTPGVLIGKTAGTKLAGKAGILGGLILIAIGLEIFITNVF